MTPEPMARPSLSSVYRTDQVEKWLEHIGLPRDFRPEHEPGKDLEALTLVQTHHLSSVPFENFELHYTTHHSISLDPQVLYSRIVERGQGGYCMQGNLFYEHMLRGLGFEVYSTGARSRRREKGIPTGPWTGWTHQVIIATLAGGRRYVVDVAFGGDCPIFPLPLEEGIVSQNKVQKARLVREALGHDKSQKTWVYQCYYQADGQWHGVFCFGEAEFLAQDFKVMSYYTSTHDSSWLANTVMGTLFIREGNEIVGKYTIADDVVRKHADGKIEKVAECKDEEERIDALKKYFGVALDREEVAAIQGWPAGLKTRTI